MEGEGLLQHRAGSSILTVLLLTLLTAQHGHLIRHTRVYQHLVRECMCKVLSCIQEHPLETIKPTNTSRTVKPFGKMCNAIIIWIIYIHVIIQTDRAAYLASYGHSQ